MVIVSSREFRAKQKKYFSLALSNERKLEIKSRSLGSYKLVPLSEDDTIAIAEGESNGLQTVFFG